MGRKTLDIAGQEFSRLRVIYATKERDRNGTVLWLCKCTCGKTYKTTQTKLKLGLAKSCGCRMGNYKHGHCIGKKASPERSTWNAVMTRCYNKNYTYYENYGGRGIKVCKRWHKFENFLADMGERPIGKELDRRNNDGNYEPENCRWVTRKKNANNKGSNIRVRYRGRNRTLTQWCRKLGLPYNPIRMRIRKYGWPISKALTTPVREFTKFVV